MATYRTRYGAPPSGATGAFAGWMGDPRVFGAAFQDGGAIWRGTPDTDGNYHFLLFAGPNKQPLYDWAETQKRNVAGYADARDLCRKVAAQNATTLGLSYATASFLEVAGGQLDTQTVRLAGGQLLFSSTKGATPSARNVHLFELPQAFQLQLGDAEQALMGSDRGSTSPDASSDTAWAHNIAFRIKPGDGSPPFVLRATVHLWLRIGYITGFDGEVIGGDDWIPEAIRTLVDIVEAVVGYFTANVGLIIAAGADIVKTWWQYADAKAQAAADAEAKGAALGRGGTFFGGSQQGGGGTGPGGLAVPHASRAPAASSGGGALLLAAGLGLLLYFGTRKKG